MANENNSQLFDFFTERAGIIENDGDIDRGNAEALALAETEAFRHNCEVRNVVARYRKDGGEAVKDFLSQVARHRGQAAADRLRTDALNALKEK